MPPYIPYTPYTLIPFPPIPPFTMETISILGFGNPVREDDGVGIYVIEQLNKELSAPHIEILDMGTSAFEVLFKLQGRDKIILIDAVVNTGEPVGTLFRLPAEEVEGQIEDDPLVFLHGLKWHQALSYARKMLQDEYPKDVEVFLIAVDHTRFDLNISAEAQAGADRLVKLLLEELQTTASL